MKKIILTITMSFFMACNMPENISDQEANNTLDTLFEIVDNDIDRFGDIVTDDFFIFENSRTYTKDEFVDYVKSFGEFEAKRSFEDVVIDTDQNSAHLSLKQHGEFIVTTPEGKIQMIFDWLESVYMVKEQEQLKVKFYFSEVVNDTIISLN
ncbi:MAG: hypothetical protein ACPH12_06100 [Flavobacteriaceae bacterium]